MVAIIVGGKVKHVVKPGTKPEPPPKVKRVRKAKPREVLTFDPRFLKQNRELRDRYLERVNDDLRQLAGGGGKYDVFRSTEGAARRAIAGGSTGVLRALPASVAA